MTTTVFIWNNSGDYFRGHASVSIGSAPVVRFTDDHRHAFASWGDGSEPSHRKNKSAGVASLNVLHDFVKQEYAPDHIIQIPTSTKSEVRMLTYWMEVQNKRVAWDARADQTSPAPSYDTVSKNASSIAQRILKSGNIGWALNPLQWNIDRKHHWWTPLNVRDLALSYSGAKRISWIDWVCMQGFTYEEKELLFFLQRRKARHGSSGALPELSKPVNVRILHLLGDYQYSGYSNECLLDVVAKIGDPGATFLLNQEEDYRVVDQVTWNIRQILEAFEESDFRFFGNQHW